MHAAITVISKYFILIPVIGLAYIFLGLNKKQRIQFLLFLVVSGVCSLLLVKVATTIYYDPRPFISDGVKPYFASSTDNGFPSDHTVLSSLLALVVLRYSRKLGAVLLAVAMLIGSSRVIAGVHHTRDIVGGLVIGGASYALVTLAFHKLPLSSKH